MKKPYREGTSLEHIITDGWSRGFDPSQCRAEAAIMGYKVSLKKITTQWKELDNQLHGDSTIT